MNAAPQRPVRSTWFVVVLTVMILGCASAEYAGDGGNSDTTTCSISKTKGVVNESFSSRLTVYSNYVTVVEFSPNLDGSLPPGIYWDSATGTFSGTPTTLGTYNVTVYFRDVTKGTVSNPNLADNLWYIQAFEFEISRFQQPEGGGYVSVTFVNTATWATHVYVDGADVARLEPGESKILSLRAGTRVLQYSDSAGGLGNEEVRRFEAGSNYTVTLSIR